MKKHGIKKRVLATLMTACMIVGAVPGGALADVTNGSIPLSSLSPYNVSYKIDGNQASGESDTAIQLSKTARLINDGKNDKYKITLTVNAENAENQIEVKSTEVAFVLDASGSMAWCTDATHNHTFALGGYACSRVSSTNPSRWNTAVNAIESMSAELTSAGVICDYIYYNRDSAQVTDLSSLKNDIEPKGSTPISDGVKKGIQVLNDSEAANKILIVIADGCSTDGYMEHHGESILWYQYDNEQKILSDFKSNGKLYTVSFAINETDGDPLGLFNEANDTKFKALANAGNLNAKNESELNQVFSSISKDITSGIEDPLDENVKYVDGTVQASNGTATYDEVTKTIKWNSNGAMNGNVTLSYTVELTDDAKKNVEPNAEKIYLNKNDAVFNYSYMQDGVKTEKSVKFPKPYVTGAALTVKYVNNGTTVKTADLEWVALINGSETFKGDDNFTDGKITAGSKITVSVGDEDKTYYVTSDKTVPAITQVKSYTLEVPVSENPPVQKYTVSYNANGGAWSAVPGSATGYSLSEDGTVLSNSELIGTDRIKNLTGGDAPSRSGYTFKGWNTAQDGSGDTLTFYGTSVSQLASGSINTLYAIWEEDGSAPAETVTYTVRTHYIDTDENDARINITVEGQTAEKDSLISNKISNLLEDKGVYGTKYLYTRATVTVDNHITNYVNDSKFQSGENIIDLYYYRDAWKDANDDGNDSETGGDGIADIEQVLVKFGNKDENGTVSGDGIVQVFTLHEEETSVELNGTDVVTIAAPGYEFQKWTLNNSNEAVDPFRNARSVKGGDELDFYAWFVNHVPSKPVGTNIVSKIVVECQNSESGHGSKIYDVVDSSSVVIGEVRNINGTYVSEITVKGAYYADKYNNDVEYAHDLNDVNDVTYNLKYINTANAWRLFNTTTGEYVDPTSEDAYTLIDTVKVDCSNDHHDPEIPTDDQIKEFIGNVTLVHTGSNASHEEKEYELIDGSYTVASASNATAIVTVNAAKYVTEYNKKYGTHAVQGDSFRKVIFTYVGDGYWNVEDNDLPVEFVVKCEEKKEDEKPKLPDNKELKNLFGESITVSCTTDKDHEAKTFGLLDGSYSVTRDNEDDCVAVVTIRAAKYITAYLDGTHTNAGDDASRVELYYDADTAKWYATDSEIGINFKAKCEKKTPNPDKQYSDIKFIVVNGTFTENGQTEITKSFEVGTKLTLTDIPASKGKSSRYCDQTWDKYPLGYVVKEDGTTFTITYRWRSNSDSDSDSDSTTTRGRATNAAGKSGRWILEGGEFTEDNGKLPSNEYLKIGDTIYGFYTHGFAIDFDRPEYYTDAAIQAKGGYRDATGTWRLNGWWFCYDDGTFPHNEWVYLTWNGHSDWYFFDVDGWMEDGWFFWNNNWYYLHTQYDNTRGHMYTGWHEIDGKWYYFNTASDKGTLGAMLANTTTPDGYKVDASGAMIQ